MTDITQRIRTETAALKDDEVMSRYVRKMLKSGRAQPSTVLDYLGEQRVIAYQMLLGLYSARGRMADWSTEDLRSVQAKLGLALRRASPFLWTHEMRSLALQYDVPSHTIGPAAFPHELMWWTFETAIGIPGDERRGVDGMLIARASRLEEFGLPSPPGAPDGWALVEVGSSTFRDDGRSHLMRSRSDTPEFFVELVAALPDGTQSNELGEHARVLGCAAFLNSRVVDVSTKRPSDTDKRWHGRRVGDPASLHVVTLRAAVREAVATERGEGPQWKQRWLVRGHLRAQWYPSTKSHQVIWIAPYLKGPEDAPLKVPVYRVAR